MKNLTKKNVRLIVFACVAALLLCAGFAEPNPLINNRKITTVMTPYVSSPVKGDFTVPLWSLTGNSLFCGGRIIDIINDMLEVRGKIDLGPNTVPFGWNYQNGNVFSVRDEFGNSDINVNNIKNNNHSVIDLQVRKSWRKIRILDPNLGMNGLIYGILQREAEESNVKDCFVFSMDQSGGSYRQLSDNSIINVKSKMIFVGKTVAFGRLRYPSSSYDGKFISYLALKDIDPKKYLFDLCVRNDDGTSPRVVLKNLSHPGPPCWSPDGRFLAVMSRAESGEAEVIITDINGKILSRIPANSHVKDEAYHLNDVSWSFDGEWIAFVKDNGISLGIASKSGEQQFNVAQLKISETDETKDILMNPRWSPSGYSLVYEQMNLSGTEKLSFLYLVRFIP